MKGTILLDYNENLKRVEEEEKARFLRGLLEQIFENTDVVTQIQEIWDVEGTLSATQKVKMRGILTTYGIQVIDDLDGHMEIRVDGELVAEWHKCIYKLRKDLQQADPHKRLYLEMVVSCWSAFEQQSEQETE